MHLFTSYNIYQNHLHNSISCAPFALMVWTGSKPHSGAFGHTVKPDGKMFQEIVQKSKSESALWADIITNRSVLKLLRMLINVTVKATFNFFH